MPAVYSSLVERITADPDVRFGKPCIRGHRITVQEILEWLSSGASQEQILADYPQLEPDDFLAVYAYAAELAVGPKSPEVEAPLRRKPVATFPELSACCSSSLAPKSSFSVHAIIQPGSPRTCFAVMRSASLSSLLRGIN